jgi:AbrB family looped-hinge helix DNA binding protein
MERTKLSSKGQIVLPKAIRESRRWPAGTEFLIEDTPRGILLRPRKLFASTEPPEVFGRLKPRAGARTVKQMDAGLRHAFKSRRS